jgi:hypothetical protein
MRIARLVTVVALTAVPLPASPARQFGKPLQGLPAAKLSEVLARPEAGRTVRLEGTIEKVCQNKGCWVTLRQGEQRVHVTFEGYSFFLPKDSASRPAVLEGKVVVQEPKAGHVEHLKAEGAGDSAASRVSIEATGVELP